MRKLFCLLLLFPFSLFAGVDLTTIDNFNIFSTSEHDLIVSKPGHKDRVNFIAFRMERPFCICANPVISLGSDKVMEQGLRVKGTITVDMTKPVETLLQVMKQFESGHVLFRPLQFPSLRSSKVVTVNTEFGTSELFLTKGIDNAMEQSKSMCESDWYYEEVEPKIKEMDV